MDVKYIPSDWEKMKDGLGDLIGLGRWGKGMIDNLKDLNDNLEDAEGDIAKYDSDGVISFHHTSQKDKYQGLYEDFEILHSFTGKVGDIVDRTIDQPFYEDMDAFVEAMRDLTISNYTTKNRIGATDTQFVYAAYGPAQSFTVPKTEVGMDDLFSGDNYFGEQMKVEYDAWKELNPDQDFSQEEYQQAALNTRAFQYESIRDQQESKEFWVQIGALVVIVGATLICPPAGMALGAAYGAMELSSAVSGKDWVSGRELGTGERWFRGLLAPLDIVPGVSGLSKFSSTVRLAHAGDTIGQLGLKTGVKAGFHQGVTHIDNMLTTAGRQSVARLKNASAAIKDASNVVKNKLEKDTIEAARLVDNTIAQAKNITSSRKIGLVLDEIEDVGKVQVPSENTHAVENKLKDMLSKIEGINFDSGTKKLTEGTKGKYGFDATSDLKGYNEQIYKELEKQNITLEKFHELRLKSTDFLTSEEIMILKEIRDAVPPVTKDTLLQKTLPFKDVEKYLSGDYKEIGGYVAKVEDVANIRMYDDVVESSRLDYTTWDGSRPYPEGGDSYGMIRFRTPYPDKIDIPYGERFGGSTTDGPPCTLNGFTGARNGKIVPEWQFQGRFEPEKGAELYRVTNGIEKLVAVFDKGAFRPID